MEVSDDQVTRAMSALLPSFLPPAYSGFFLDYPCDYLNSDTNIFSFLRFLGRYSVSVFHLEILGERPSFSTRSALLCN